MARSAVAALAAALALVCASAAAAPARMLLQDASTQQAPAVDISRCPIRADTSALDFAPVAAACDAQQGGDFCAPCICAMVDTYLPAFAAAGVKLDPANPDAFPVDTATAIITTCTQEYFVQMLLANVDVASLEALSSCDFNATAPPACLAERLQRLSELPQVEASDRSDDGAAGGLPLRVATMVKTPTGTNFTLAGTLQDLTQLLGAMNASPELLSMLSPAQAAQLEAVSGNPSGLQAQAEVDNYLATLVNPVNADEVIARLAAFQQSAPAAGSPDTAASSPAGAVPTPVGAPAPTQAPPATSGAARIAVPAVGAIAMLVALLL